MSTSTATDLDLVVKLIDQNPDGAQFTVADGVLRARYRNSLSNPEPFPTNTTVALTVDLLERFHTFKKGHAVLLHIQSSWFPRIDRNPQRFVPNIFEAQYPKDFGSTMVRVHRSPQFKSRIEMPILKTEQWEAQTIWQKNSSLEGASILGILSAFELDNCKTILSHLPRLVPTPAQSITETSPNTSRTFEISPESSKCGWCYCTRLRSGRLEIDILDSSDVAMDNIMYNVLNSYLRICSTQNAL